MSAFRFRVLLDSEKDQEIFRDIIIDENENFETFYRAILASFNFEGKEMGSFYMSNDEWDKGYEIGLMDMSFSDEEEELPGVMSQSTLKDFMEAPDQKIILVYDFLRMWIFLIELQGTSDKNVSGKPEIAMTVGIAPPEDSRLIQEDLFGSEDYDEEGDSYDEEGYEDGYDEEDLGGYEEYEY